MTLNDSNYPDDFNWKFYTSYYPDLSHLNKIQAISIIKYEEYMKIVSINQKKNHYKL